MRITYLVAFAALVLVSVCLPDGSDRDTLVRDDIARSYVALIYDAARMFHLDHGRWPSLSELTEGDRGGHCCLDTLPRDPWDHDYEVRELRGDRCEVRSRGPDGVPDTADDLVVPRYWSRGR